MLQLRIENKALSGLSRSPREPMSYQCQGRQEQHGAYSQS